MNTNPNEVLIKKVSNQITLVKPDTKVLFSSIQDRQKGQFIIQYFPWPIGVEIRRLISGDRISQDQNRLEQLLKLGERSIQFLAFSLICDLWSNKENIDFSISPDLKHHINEIDYPSLGTWVGLIRASSSIINKFKEHSFFSKSEANWKKLNLLSQQFVEIRNKKVHHNGEIDFDQVEELISNLLVELCFLTKFEMVTVRDIQVYKSRLNPVNFEHNLALLNSTHKDFEAKKVNSTEFAESQAVLLLSEQNIYEPYLNLFPLIIDTKSFQNSNSQIKGAHGVFLYHHRKQNKITYSGTEPLSNTDASIWGIENDISSEIDDLKKSLSNE